MTLSSPARARLGIPVLLAFCIPLAGCGTTYPEDLRALQADPMAGVELSDGELVQEFTTDASARTKLTAATYTAEYRPDDGVTVQELFDEAVATAIDAGWDMDAPGETSVEGSKRLETGAARISIASGVVDDEERLIIFLEHEFDHAG
jgi:hypothetical protein